MVAQAESTTLSIRDKSVSRLVAELVSSGSLEINAHRPEDAAAVAEFVPVGTSVFVNHLPRQPLGDSLAALLAIRRAGLLPVPHIAARRVRSSEELSDFMARAVQEAGVRRALVIGGDAEQAMGPFPDAQSVLEEGTLGKAGIREIGLATYPEGHPQIAQATLESAFAAKLDLVKQQGASAFAITQFSFAPARIADHCAQLYRKYPELPVYVGVAGPASTRGLLQFAQRCGVSASLRALHAQGMTAVRALMQTDPGEQLAFLAQQGATRHIRNIVGAHFFTFGGAARTAAFMLRAITAERLSGG